MLLTAANDNRPAERRPSDIARKQDKFTLHDRHYLYNKRSNEKAIMNILVFDNVIHVNLIY